MSRAVMDGGGPAAPSPFPFLGVNPADLDTAAKVAHDTGQAMPEELKTIQQPSDDAVAALTGWLTGGSLSACTAAWEECLKKLGAEVDGVGDKLTATANNYRSADNGGANSFLLGPYGRNSLLGN